MEIFGFDFTSLFTLSNLLALCLGTFVGLVIGALPGLGSPIAIILLLPLTYSMEPLASILMLLAAFQAAEYGGSISAIILGIPGIPAAAATVLDGNAMSKQGKPGKALMYSLSSSSFGGIVGGLVLLFLAVPFAKFALQFTDPEFFLIGVLGLIGVATLSTKDMTKSAITVVLGLMAGTIGQDVFSGQIRFGLGRPELSEGLNIIPVMVGMFAFSELFSMISKNLNRKIVTDLSGLKTRISWKELKSVAKPASSGSVIGSVLGMFPGLGADAASWFSYTLAKKMSKKPETFGQGNPEGIAAPEAANNASVGGSMVPLLSLGIPGSPTIAIIMGAFIIHGITLGPRVFTSESKLVYGILFGFLLTTVFMFLIGKLVTPAFSRILTVRNEYLIPSVLIFSIIGVFVSQNMFFELWLALILGVVSYFMILLEFSVPTFILAFVLCPVIEESLRRSLLLSSGSYSIFVTRPYSLAILLIIAAIIGFVLFNWIRKAKAQHATERKDGNGRSV